MIEITVTGIERGERFLARIERGIPSATSRAINDGARFARTLTRRGIMTETGLPGKYITPSLRMAFAKPTNLVGGVGATAKNIPLIAYYRRAFKSGKGIAGETYSLGAVPPRAFYIQWRGSGNKGIYARAGRPRWPVRKVYGPPLTEVIVRKHIFQSLTGPVGDRYRTRLLHHFERIGGEGVSAESDSA
jgi:hypothetical protein